MKFCTLLSAWMLFTLTGTVFANTSPLIADSIIVNGNVYLDNNTNSMFDINDIGLNEVEVEIYEDINHNDEIDNGDIKIKSSITNKSGEYSLAIEKQTFIQISNKVSSSSDDAVQNEPGGIMVLDGLAASGIREIGLRFTDIDLQQAARIESASLKITMANGSEDFIEIIVKGEATDNATTFIDQDYNIYTRPRTNTVVGWTSPIPRNIFQEIEIDGIAGVIQEIVNRPGWRKGNSLVLVIADFDCDMFMFDAGYPAELIINYKDEEPENTSYIVAPKVQNVNPTYELFSEPFIFSKSVNSGNSEHLADFGFSLKEIDIEEPIIEEIVTPQMQIWPNPTVGPIHINASGITDMEGFTINVYGMNGKIFNNENLYFTDEGKADYNLSHLSKGTYVVVITNGNGVLFSEKVIVQ